MKMHREYDEATIAVRSNQYRHVGEDGGQAQPRSKRYAKDQLRPDSLLATIEAYGSPGDCWRRSTVSFSIAAVITTHIIV